MDYSFFQYRGKTDEKYLGEPKWHPLAYHSLDVAVCGASVWLEVRALHPQHFNPFTAEKKHG